MPNNSFGQIFTFTTWGESHGKAIGVIIDGCPAGLELSDSDILEALLYRAPGRNAYVSPRKETEQATIYSGIFDGITTGTPISIVIPNGDSNSSHYESTKDLLKPSHANFPYLEKYGVFDYRGGGRASARETAGRVAAGAIAKKLLKHYGVSVVAYLKQVKDIVTDTHELSIQDLRSKVWKSPIFCPDDKAEAQILELLDEAKKQGDSLGGIVEFRVEGIPSGLGDPIYNKLDARLAYAMLSINASKGFELGAGFQCVHMQGSEHNDPYITSEGKVVTATNHSGGVLAGISTGMPLVGRVAFKPTSSIMRNQDTVTQSGEKAIFNLPEGSRHDPCVSIRGVPVVEAMCAVVIVDALLSNRTARI